MKSPLRAAALFLCVACSKSGIRLSDGELTERRPIPAVIELDLPLPTVAASLKNYLASRNRLASTYVPPENPDAEVRFQQPWIRDTSLRYYTLEFDTRRRHTVDWKALWTLKRLEARRTEIHLDIVEILFMGPPYEAGPGPLLNGQWFETERDTLRARLELRRFWNQKFPGRPLPAALGQIAVPSIEASPLAKSQLEPTWKPLKRRRAF